MTGYTEFICNDKVKTAEEFLLLCTSAFGYMAEFKDDPLSVPIDVRFVPSDYHEKALQREKEYLESYRRMTPEAIHFANMQDNNKQIEQLENARAKWQAENEKLQPILEGLEKWVPPTPEHEALKRFAIEQVKISLNDLSWLPESLAMRTDEEWIDSRIKNSIEAIDYHEKGIQKDIETAEKKNRWLDALKKSVLVGQT